MLETLDLHESFLQSCVSGVGTGHYMLWVIRIMIGLRIQDPNNYPDCSAEVCRHCHVLLF